jgi:hypothetical protein
VDAIGDTKGPEILFATQWMLDNYPETSLDKQKEYALLTASDLDWTMVRLPLITLTHERPKININLHNCTGNAVGATSLADFLVDQLSDDRLIGKCPFVANEPG